MQPFNPGGRPSQPDPRDYSISALYLQQRAAGLDVLTLPVKDTPLPPTLDQGQTPHCIAYGIVGAMQTALWDSHKAWVPLDPDAFYAAGIAAGTADPVAGWDFRSALLLARSQGVPAQDGKHYKVDTFYRVPLTRPDITAAIRAAGATPNLSPLLWSTAWPDRWFAPRAGTGLESHYDGAPIHYGHGLYIWREVARIYGTSDTCETPRNSWGAAWGIGGGNCEVATMDVLDPRLGPELWAFTVVPDGT